MRHSFRRLTTSSLLAGTALIAFAPMARAQAPAPGAPQTLGEVVVTAQKRSENLQNVPLAVNVVNAQALQANSVRTFTDLTRASPSLIIRPAETAVNSSISVRGIGTYAFSPGVEPSVAVVVDDVPLAFQARAFADLSDVERVEVLRGPQSTLYGKSASAGLINIVTPGPSKIFTARVGGLATTDKEWQAQAMVSGPIAPNLGFRLTANYDTFDGNVHNLYTGKRVNGREIFSTHDKLQWQPTDAITVTGEIDYVNGSTTTGRPFFRTSPTTFLQGNPAVPPSVWAPGITIGPDNTNIVNNVTTSAKYEDVAESLHINWDLGGPTLMSITSNDKFRLKDIVDHDDSAVALYDNRQGGVFDSTQVSQEFRLVSPGKDRFRYTLGAFYQDVNFIRDFTRGPAFSLARWHSTNESRLFAGFGQLEYDILPKTTVIVGGRVASDKVSYTFRDIRAGTYFSGNDTDAYSTYKVALQQHFADNIMGFVSYATGHKGEAYDLSTGFNAVRAAVGPIKPETSKDLEVGLRTQFFEKRLTLNVTAFNSDYTNFQAQGIETLPDSSVNFRLTNVGRLRTRGVEVETSARLDENLTVGGAVTYDDARIIEFPLAQCYGGQTLAQGCLPAVGAVPSHQNLAGARPPQAPVWKMSFNFDYSHDLGSSPFKLAVQGAYSYQSGINFTIAQNPEGLQAAYGIANLSFGVRQPERHYEIMAFVNNMFDQHYFEFINDARGNYANSLATQSYIPRDFRRYGGVRFSYTY